MTDNKILKNTVLSRNNLTKTAARPRLNRGVTAAKPRWDRGETEVRPRLDLGWTAARPRLDRGVTAISYWWPQQLRRRIDYSARIRKVAIVSEFGRHLHTMKFQNFKTAVILLRSAFIVQRLWRKMTKYIAWWLIKETNYNKPWHFEKNAKQINVYIQIIELAVHFENICFVTMGRRLWIYYL